MQPDVELWWRFALDDLRMAQTLAREPGVPARGVGYHAEQAAEKALKAMLIAYRIAPPRTHSLALLCQLVAPLEPTVAAWEERLAPVSAFAVEARYPDAFAGPVTLEEAVSALVLVTAFIEFIRSLPALAGEQ